MRCLFCGYEETKVVDSRASESGETIRRRRECLKCKQRFTTFEKVEEIPIMVIKKGGAREPFEHRKLLDGLIRATIKRPIPVEKLEQIVSDIETDLRNQFKYEVESSKLGEMVLRKLRRLDKVAYVRFASVYREYKDLDEFTAELERLQKRGG